MTQAEGYAPDFRGRVAMALTKTCWPQYYQAERGASLFPANPGLAPKAAYLGFAVTCGSLVASTGLEVRSHP